MKVFPMGTVAAGVNYGTIDGVQCPFFEPNSKAFSHPIHYSLQTLFQNQSILTRKIAEPSLSITYEYTNIYFHEFLQIKECVADVEEAVDTIYVVDLSAGTLPDSMPSWVPHIGWTGLYSSVANMKANYMFLNNSTQWKIGVVNSIVTNTSIQLTVTDNYGDMTEAQAAVVTGNARTHIYPMYECYIVPNSLQNFSVTGYWSNKDSMRGPMWSGSISFTSKYRI